MRPGGRVVFVTSSTTKTSAVTPEYLVYTASKGAAEQLVRVLAKDLGARGITVNAVSPGATDTDFFRSDGKSAEFVQLIAGLFPQKQIPRAEDIAPLVAFLARDEAGWVNGQTVMVNGVRALGVRLYGTSCLIGGCFAGDGGVVNRVADSRDLVYCIHARLHIEILYHYACSALQTAHNTE